MSNLVLALHDEEKLDPIVARELTQLMSSIQTWANQLTLSQENLKLNGIGTFLGQPRAKTYRNTVLSIADSTDTIITWPVIPVGLNASLETYDTGLFDGSTYFVLTEPGLYYAQVEISWAASAAGYRHVGIHPRISAVDYFNSVGMPGSAIAGATRQCVGAMFPVIKPDTPIAYVPYPLGVGVQVYQNSGGPLNIVTGNFGVWKIS